MATININGIRCYYQLQGEGDAVVLLHGWGQNTEMMQFIQDHLSNRFQVLNLDFPGFGQSEQPPVAWGVSDYAQFLEQLLNKLNISSPILIAHSFGCRVAFHYAAKKGASKMILTGAAGLRGKETKVRMKTKVYKRVSSLLKLMGAEKTQEKLKSVMGSADYRQATGVMRDTLVKVVNDDVSDLLDKIDCPTFLFWGKEDDATPLWMGQEMEKRMKNAGLAVVENEGHYAYFYQPQQFCRALDSFLGGK